MTDHDRIASLDLLRGLAALAVAIPHYLILNSIAAERAETISVLSVEVFFVLSGFVLAPQIVDCVRAKSFGRLRIFLIRRWMRTIPPYLFALLAISILADRVWTADFARYALYIQNLFFQANASDYYSVAWSLSVEEWFYVVFPVSVMLILWGAARPGNAALIVVALGFTAAIAFGRLVFGPVTDWGENVRRVVAFRIDSIAYGFVLGLVLARLLPITEGVTRYAIPAFAIALGCSFVAFRNLVIIGTTGNPINEGYFPFLAALFGCSILLCFYVIAPLIERFPLGAGVSIYLGRISYSVYLLHIIAAELLFPYATALALSLQLAIYIGVVIGFCSMFYWYFERPILAMRPRYLGQKGVYILASHEQGGID